VTKQPTLLAVHAHPDDEAIFTGGLLARAADLGWQTVVVVATSGERGLAPTGDPSHDDSSTARHRRLETLAAAKILGVTHVEFLGYTDSGAEYGDFAPGSLAAAPITEVVARVQSVVDTWQPTLITSYDHQGIYGHPDHVVVHDVARAVVTDAGLYESTISRPALTRLHDRWLALGMSEDTWPRALTQVIGLDHDEPEDLVAFEVGDYHSRKHAAIAAHDSQIVTAQSFMGLPPGVFHALVATEWFHCVRSATATPF
jgi:LmbE family N-acetylglucosaminyl deacetylase